MPKKIQTISIVTPSYNQSHFIRQTIDSVVSQMEKGDEYVVLDGGSTDDTVEILRSYGAKIRFESKKDGGQANALNKGLRQVSNDIFAYINSDDYYLPHAFEKVREIFCDPNVFWAVGDAIIVDENGTEIQQAVRWYKKIWRAVYSLSVLSVLNPIPQPAVFIRRQVLEEVGTFDEHLHYVMDYDLWIRLQQRYGIPLFIQDTLAAFRIHKKSKGGSSYQKQFSEELQAIARYVQNPFLLWLHRLHNQCILRTYAYLKH